MELDSVCVFAVNLEAGIPHIVGRTDAAIVVRNRLDSISVAHPDLGAVAHSAHQRAVAVYELKVGTTVFPDFRLLDFSAAPLRKILG